MLVRSFVRNSWISVSLLAVALLFPGSAWMNARRSAVAMQSGGLLIKQKNPVVNEGNRIRLAALDAAGNPAEAVRWVSGSPDIAQVDTLTGEISGVKQGFSTITAQRGGESASVFVVVARVRKGPGETVPGDTKADASGRIYLSNPQQNVILTASKALESPLELYAGTKGVKGLRDGGVNQALFAGPTALTVNNMAQGGVYLADTLNHSVRKIGSNQVVETILGSGSPGLPLFDGNGKTAFERLVLNGPRGIATDKGGNLLLADTNNHAIYYADMASREVTLLAGQPGVAGKADGEGGVARFFRPAGIALDQTGRVLAVADQDNNLVRLLELVPTPTGGLTARVTTIGAVAGRNLTEPADLTFRQPVSVGFDSSGNVLVVDAESVYVVTQPLGPNPQKVELAQPGSFQKPASVMVQGTESFILDVGVDTSESLQAVTVGAPEINGVSKTTVRIEGGAEIVVTGKNFAPESVVVLGDALVDGLEVRSATELRFQSPRQLTHGDRTLTIQTRGGIAQTKVTVIPKPVSELAVGEITTVAGGIPYLGDGGEAVKSALSAVDVAVDSLGNLYVADRENSRIRSISPKGIITTIAGTGIQGTAGDTDAAVTSQLSIPETIALDGKGNLFVGTQFQKIRRIDGITGKITSLTGINAGAALAIDGQGNLFYADNVEYAKATVYRMDAVTGKQTVVAGGQKGFSGDGGLATSAAFSYVTGLSFDSAGNLYVTDTGNERIRRVDVRTRIVTTIAGNGDRNGTAEDGNLATKTYLHPLGKTVFDVGGNLLFADGFKVRRIDAISQKISTVAGIGYSPETEYLGDGGPAILARLVAPRNLSLDGQGNLFIADGFRVRRVDARTGIISTLAGYGKNPVGFEYVFQNVDSLSTSTLFFVKDIEVDQTGNLYLFDGLTGRLYLADMTTGTRVHFAGNGSIDDSSDGGPAIKAGIYPNRLKIGPAGNLYLCESNIIRRIDVRTGIITRVAGNGQFGSSGDGGPALRAGIRANEIEFDEKGNLFISDIATERVRRVDAQTGIISAFAGLSRPAKNSSQLGDGGPAAQAAIVQPSGLAVDFLGNVFISQVLAQNRLRKVDAKTGLISTLAGAKRSGFQGDDGLAANARLNLPLAITVDGAGNLFIADTQNRRVRRVDVVSGVISTVAGGLSASLPNNDGGSALKANLFPLSVKVDGQGNLYIVDGRTVRVVKGIAVPRKY
ncbi:MAG: Ig-like domain-containing protein [Blastocatellia bacterium]|nr:Ig-like domain-containing protein [Blastocatellia bacterium]